MMRIITGRARGVRLNTLAGENTRPTSERAKEAIFSILQFELQGKEVLDLFAGSGQMALEALSRGALHAVLCDSSKAAADVIRSNAIKTRLAPMCEIVTMDWEVLLRNQKNKRKFGLVFIDPPYAMGAVSLVLEKLLQYGLLEEDAKLVCETAEEADVFGGNDALQKEFDVVRTARYGAAAVTILTPHKEGENA